MSIQEEIHKAMKDLSNSSKKGGESHMLSSEDFSLLLLTSLIEDEGENVKN